MRRMTIKSVSIIGAAVLSVSTPAMAAGPSVEEFNLLKQQVEEQRRLLVQLMRVEQQHYELLLELVQGGAGAGKAPDPVPGEKIGLETPPPAAAAAPRRPVAERTASVTGRVQVAGGDMGDIYVYVQNTKSPAARGSKATLTIEQKNKQFVPAVAVVQRGTKVSFPSRDAVFHNVFSPSPPHPFDLGSYRAGDSAGSVELSAPGVVDVFCNIHSNMHAQILVVPNALYARVGADGSFRIENVPVGSRKLVAWGPKIRLAQETVEVTPNGAEVQFMLTPEAPKPHNNKLGQPYSSYKE